MTDSELRRLKRKRSTERTKATRFTTLINEFVASTPPPRMIMSIAEVGYEGLWIN
jgi:uncharacterized protein (DUF1800 family)